MEKSGSAFCVHIPHLRGDARARLQCEPQRDITQRAARAGAALEEVGAVGEALGVDAQTETVVLLQNTVQSL